MRKGNLSASCRKIWLFNGEMFIKRTVLNNLIGKLQFLGLPISYELKCDARNLDVMQGIEKKFGIKVINFLVNKDVESYLFKSFSSYRSVKNYLISSPEVIRYVDNEKKNIEQVLKLRLPMEIHFFENWNQFFSEL